MKAKDSGLPTAVSGCLLLLMTALVLGCIPLEGQAAEGNQVLVFQGQPVPLDILLQDEAGTVYLPLSFLASVPGLQCERDARTTVAQIRFKERVLCLAPGIFAMMLDGDRIPLPAAPQLVEGALFLPLRPVARALGLTLSVKAGLASAIKDRRRLSKISTGSDLPTEFAAQVTDDLYFARSPSLVDEMFKPTDPEVYPRGRFCVGLDVGYYKPWGGDVPKASLEWKPIYGARILYAFHPRLAVEERYEVWKFSRRGRHFLNPQRDGNFKLQVKSLFLGLVHFFPSSSRWRFGVACGGVLNWVRLGYDNGMISLLKQDDTVGYEIKSFGEYFMDETVSVTMELRYRGATAGFSIPEVGQEFELDLDSAFGTIGLNYYFD